MIDQHQQPPRSDRIRVVLDLSTSERVVAFSVEVYDHALEPFMFGAKGAVTPRACISDHVLCERTWQEMLMPVRAKILERMTDGNPLYFFLPEWLNGGRPAIEPAPQPTQEPGAPTDDATSFAADGGASRERGEVQTHGAPAQPGNEPGSAGDRERPEPGGT